MPTDPLQQVKTQLAELIEAAKSGAIIPIRLPGQLEDIQSTLLQAEEAIAEEIKAAQKPAATGDAATIIHENAEFIKTAIHELRTPMTSIRGYSDMLSNPAMSGELNDMQNQLLDVIRTNSRRMEGLLSDMSYINKLRAGILTVNPKMDMFKNIAQRAEKLAEPIAEELNRNLEFDIPQGLPILTTDGELLALAMLKLIENGLRYSPEGEGHVIVRGKNEDNDLIIVIEDNGIGMTEEELNQLGVLFYRGESDAVRAFKGSGMGLPIAYGLVDALNGTIEVTSQPNGGTRFEMRFTGMT